MLVRPVIAVGSIAVNADIRIEPIVFGTDTSRMPGSGPFFGLAVIVKPGTVASALGRPPGVVTVAPTGAPQTAAVAVAFGTIWSRIATQLGFGFAPPKTGCSQGSKGSGAAPARAQSVAFTPA